MKCEYCKEEHTGSYGSGRFCNEKCAHGFSTKIKRKEINEKVSRKLIGRPSWTPSSFKTGYDKRRHKFTDKDRQKSVNGVKIFYEKKFRNISYENLSKGKRIEILLNEQIGKCNNCNLNIWLNKPITLELHHKDCNKHNHNKNNEELLCPNCHSYTNGWRGQKLI